MSEKAAFLEPSWQGVLQEEFEKPYVKELSLFLKKERLTKKVFPPKEEVFSAFNSIPFEHVKVVIVGQDPYHGMGQAHGLSFSVKEGVKIPPSLKNIYKELVEDVGIEMPSHGCLNKWAEQGVLLLNATLTVREREPGSHYGVGWERFTNSVIVKLTKRSDPLVFMLWGRAAQEKCNQFLGEESAKNHLVLTAAHPSPYSAYAGFFGCKHFSKANDFLTNQGKAPINWQV